MISSSDERIIAELFADLKGPKKKRDDWISIAEKCSKVIKIYGSIENAAAKLGVSYELLRSIITLLTLPEEIQELIRKGDILYDAAQRLYRIRSTEKQLEVARLISRLPSHKQREIIQYAVRFPESNIESFKNRVVKSVAPTEKLHIVVLPLTDDTYRFLDQQSTKNNVSVEKMIQKIIKDRMEKGIKA